MEQHIISFKSWFNEVDWSKYEWQQFLEIKDFKWVLGSTPFSHFQIPVVVAFAYVVSIYTLQVCPFSPFELKLILLF
jgi:hypothetical protein